MSRQGPRFASVVLDVDSTLSGIEGVDWLGERRGGALAARVRELTARAMAGDIRIEDVYAQRLDAIAPSRDDLRALGEAYVAHIAPGASAAVEALGRAGVRLEIVSGGFRPAALALAAHLGVAPACVHAVDIHFRKDGEYREFDHASPLARQNGKPELLRALALPRPILAVGDGSTDLAMKTSGEADTFAAYVGYVRRAAVVAGADHVVSSFADVLALILHPYDD